MNIIKNIFGLFMLALLALTMELGVSAQVSPIYSGYFTGMPTILTTACDSNITTGYIALQKGRGLAIMPFFAGTNAGTANVTFSLAVSNDTTNWTTNPFIRYTIAQNAAIGVRGFTNIPPTVLDNVAYARIYNITNAHSASIFLTNVGWSIK